MAIVRDHTKTLNDTTYTCRTLPASQALEYMPRIISVIGQETFNLIATLAMSDSDEALAAFDNPKVITAMLSAMSNNIVAMETAEAAQTGKRTPPLHVFKDMTKACRVESDMVMVGDTPTKALVSDHFDSHFQSRTRHMFEMFMWLVNVNFMAPSVEKS